MMQASRVSGRERRCAGSVIRKGTAASWREWAGPSFAWVGDRQIARPRARARSLPYAVAFSDRGLGRAAILGSSPVIARRPCTVHE